MIDLTKSTASMLMGETKINLVVLTEVIADLKKAVVALVMVAFLLTSTLLILCYIAFEYLVQQGLSNPIAAAMVAVFLAMLAVINYLWAEKRLSSVKKLKDVVETESPMKYLPEAEQLLHAFMEGFRNSPPGERFEQPYKEKADFE